MSSNTLCAAVLLSLVEVLAGPRTGNYYLAHIGGVGRLLEIQGPDNCREAFAKELLRFTRGGIITTSIYKLEPCFLLLPEWRDIAFENMSSNPEDNLYTRVLHQLAQFSTLLMETQELDTLIDPFFQSIGIVNTGQDFGKDNLSIEMSPLDSDLDFDFTHPLYHNFSPTQISDIDFAQHQSPNLDLESTSSDYTTDVAQMCLEVQHSLLNKVYTMKKSLDDIGAQLTTKIIDGSFAIELPSEEKDTPIQAAYHFTHWKIAVIYTTYWPLSILVNKLLLRLLPLYDPSSYLIEAECRTIALEICKIWDDAWANRPIGACHVWLGFVVAFDYCSEEVQMWILAALNKLLGDQGVREWQWTEDLVRTMSAKLMGEVDLSMYSNAE
ncbi:hypothetical protein N0V90_002491 [Kalmusia sp. IMI 367209]|nr:hypothetical protein N0V90_002491 [Kalmusia sp. IMI 367209]